MSDFRFTIVNHNGIESLRVWIDRVEEDGIAVTHIPIDDILEEARRYAAEKRNAPAPRYHVNDRVMCYVKDIAFIGIIAQCPTDANGAYHVEALIRNSRDTYPLFVQEDEILKKVEEEG